MPFKATLGGRMVFDSRPTVESARGRPQHESLVRFYSDPLLAPAPFPTKTSWSTPQEPKEDHFEGFLEECTPGSGHCTPPGVPEVEEERTAHAGIDNLNLESANDECDDETSSLGDFFCNTAASIERSWDAVKRAKQQRPNWMRWWSF